MYIPQEREETAKKAEKDFNDAQSLKDAGKLSDAIAPCSRIAKDYSDTPSAGESE